MDAQSTLVTPRQLTVSGEQRRSTPLTTRKWHEERDSTERHPCNDHDAQRKNRNIPWMHTA